MDSSDSLENMIKEHIPEYKGISDSVPGRVSNFAQQQISKAINKPITISGMTQMKAFMLSKGDQNGSK